MALINCPDCGANVSADAAACPRCARPMKGPQRVLTPDDSMLKRNRGFGDLILIPVAIIAAILLYGAIRGALFY